MSVGLRLLAALVDSERGVDEFVRLRLDESMFMGEAEAEAFQFVSAHLMKYGKMPARVTLREAGITHLPKGTQAEPPRFYFDKMRERYVFYNLKNMLQNVEVELNEDRPTTALDAMAGTMSLCQLFLHRDRLVDFAKDGGRIVMEDFHRKLKNTGDVGLRMGWPTLDLMSGGLSGGDLVAVVGRPGAGKTYLMMHAANTIWAQRQRPPLLVSMEMKPLLVMQRAIAMMAHLPITGIKHAALETKQQAKMAEVLRQNRQSGFPYWVVDGALTSTVDDIIMLARQLNPGAVLIDGAYLLRTRNQRLSRWEKLTDNAERIKGELAEGMDIPAIISYQLNREVKRGTANDDVGLENIAYTDAIGQLSSIVLAMLQEDSVETLVQRRVEILKGRSGERGHFNIHWSFDQGPDFMNFNEIPSALGQNQPPPELDYL
jgi:replicative DNA helicase